MKLRGLVLFAATLLIALSAQATTFWRCTSYNRNWSKQWRAKRATRYDAINAARRLCKNNAWHPRGCTVPSSSCVRISTNKYRNCVVRDNRNRRWHTNNCKQALRQCYRWHRDRRGNRGNCWVIRRR